MLPTLWMLRSDKISFSARVHLDRPADMSTFYAAAEDNARPAAAFDLSRAIVGLAGLRVSRALRRGFISVYEVSK